jgi:hypothetical protein
MVIVTESPPPYNSNAFPAIAVRPLDADTWQAALTRGQERGLAVERRDERTLEHVRLIGYVVHSYSTPGLLHPVFVSIDLRTGAVETTCDCEASKFSKPCQHAALAVQDANAWPAGMNVAAQLVIVPQPEPLPAEPALPAAAYRPGQFVKRLSGRTVYCVTSRHFANGHWWYELETLDRAPVDTVREDKLAEHRNTKRRVA